MKEQVAAAAVNSESGIAGIAVVLLIVVTQFGCFEDLGKELLLENLPIAVKDDLVSIIAKGKIPKAGETIVLVVHCSLLQHIKKEKIVLISLQSTVLTDFIPQVQRLERHGSRC